MENNQEIFYSKHKFTLLLIASCIIVYFNSLFGAFVWDDVSQILNNPFIQTSNNFPKFFLGSTFGIVNGTNLAGLYYRPLMTTIFSLLFSIFGPNTFYFHLLQVLIHMVNGLLVFTFLKKFFKEKLAFFLSLIFVIHPINVEAVSFISALGEPLFFFFGIIALLLSMQEKISYKKWFLIGFLILCSLFAKETGFTFLLMIIIYRLLYKKHDIIKTFGLTVSPLLIYFYIRFAVAKVFIEKIPEVPMMTAPLTQRIFTMPFIFLFYLKTFLFPYPLLISQQWSILQPNSEFFISFFISCIILAALVLFGLFIRQQRNKLFLSYLFFLFVVFNWNRI